MKFNNLNINTFNHSKADDFFGLTVCDVIKGLSADTLNKTSFNLGWLPLSFDGGANIFFDIKIYKNGTPQAFSYTLINSFSAEIRSLSTATTYFITVSPYTVYGISNTMSISATTT